jgi:hypothetical protein
MLLLVKEAENIVCNLRTFIFNIIIIFLVFCFTVNSTAPPERQWMFLSSPDKTKPAGINNYVN